MRFYDEVKTETGRDGRIRRYIITIPRKNAEALNLQAGDMVIAEIKKVEVGK